MSIYNSAKEELYYHPERMPGMWWVHPIWTQMCRERPMVGELFPNTCDLMRKEDVR